MANKQTTHNYGVELGAGIKEGLRGLNTTCSPKKRKVCMRLIYIPVIPFWVCIALGAATKNETVLAVAMLFGFCLGMYQFYAGKFKKGLIYTITLGVLGIGCLIDLFKLGVTHTFKDSNGFPLIY